MRVTVIGAGIFGATGALALARRGHQVTIVDPGAPHPDAASTDISKIVRLEYGSDAIYTELMEHALVGWRELNERWDRPLFHETGFVVLSRERLAPGGFEGDSLAVLERRGHSVERLNRSRLAERFPRFGEPFIDGYFNPAGGWVESTEATQRFLTAAQQAGAEVVCARSSVDDALAGGADRVIVAAGAWTPFLLPELQGVLRAVGQPVLHFAPSDPRAYTPPNFVPWAADIGRTGWYGFCANADGIMKVANHGPGIATDPAGPRPLPTDVEDTFRAFLAQAIPSLAAAPCVGGRLCLYCDSFDSHFLIARHPHNERVMVATGGSGHGFKFAPILGQIIADEAEGGAHAAFSPRLVGRFGWRGADQKRFEDARYPGAGD